MCFLKAVVSLRLYHVRADLKSECLKMDYNAFKNYNVVKISNGTGNVRPPAPGTWPFSNPSPTERAPQSRLYRFISIKTTCKK